MVHPYPRHLPAFGYRGKYLYSLTFITHLRSTIFTTDDVVALVHTEILRAARQYGFVLLAYCYMPDHLHMLVEGLQNDSDCLAFIRASKQYSAYYFRRSRHTALWQRYGFERMVRDSRERAETIRYIVRNAVEGALVSDSADYPFLGSESLSKAELAAYARELPPESGSHV